jgi:hypothetical protein
VVAERGEGGGFGAQQHGQQRWGGVLAELVVGEPQGVEGVLVVVQVLELSGLAVADPCGQPLVCGGEGGAFGGQPVACGVAVPAGVEGGPAGELASGGDRRGQAGGRRAGVGVCQQCRGRLGEAADLVAQQSSAALVVHRPVQDGDGFDAGHVAGADASTRGARGQGEQPGSRRDRGNRLQQRPSVRVGVGGNVRHGRVGVQVGCGWRLGVPIAAVDIEAELGIGTGMQDVA